jgi:hypothetical protein
VNRPGVGALALAAVPGAVVEPQTVDPIGKRGAHRVEAGVVAGAAVLRMWRASDHGGLRTAADVEARPHVPCAGERSPFGGHVERYAAQLFARSGAVTAGVVRPAHDPQRHPFDDTRRVRF